MLDSRPRALVFRGQAFEEKLPGGTFGRREGGVALEEEEVSVRVGFEETRVEVTQVVEVGARDGWCEERIGGEGREGGEGGGQGGEG